MLNTNIHIPTGAAQIQSLLDGKFIPVTMVGESYMRHMENEEQATQDNYTLYREYYEGLHETQLSDRLRAFMELKTTTEFNLNLCPIVVDALAERLKVTGFEAGDQGETLWQWWRDNRMDSQQGVVHTGAVRDGDFFEMVEWDNEAGRPSFSFEMACSHGAGVKVHYSQEKRNKIEYASKRWKVDKAKRLNLYFEDHIEKYISGESGFEGNWQPYTGDTGVIVLPGVFGACGWHWWTSTQGQGGEPLGVPVVHFKNKDQGYDRGQSELANVIPLQNALNKAVIDLLGSADTSGFPIYAGTGDKWAAVKVSPGRVVYSEKPDAKFGRIEAADLGPMIAVKDSFSMDIARVSRTPISYFQTSSQLPAEGSEQQREVGLIAKGEKCSTDFGNAWEDLMTIARRLHNAFGTGKLDEKQRIEAQWKPLQKRNELDLLNALTLKKQLGVSDAIIWGEMGYDAEQITKMQAAKLKSARVFAAPATPATPEATPANAPTSTAGGGGVGSNVAVPTLPREMSRL